MNLVRANRFRVQRNERNTLHTDILGQYKIDSIVEKENGASANMYSVTSVIHGLVVGDSILLTGIYPKRSFFNENVFFVNIVDSNTFDIVAGQDSSKYTYSEGRAFIRLDDATRRGRRPCRHNISNPHRLGTSRH